VPGEEEAGDEVDHGPGRRRIEAGGEGGGHPGEPAAVGERAVGGPPVAMDDVESLAVIAPENRVPMPPPIRPNGDPAGIVEKGVGKDRGSGVVLASIEGANFHRGHLL
jgi:hypothetical protein